MKSWGLGSYAIGSAAITVSLAGCGGSQPLIGAPGARTQTSAIASASPLLHSYKVLYSFGRSPDGASPDAGLTAVKGTLYGTTDAGGTSDRGTVYSISTGGAEKVLHSFGRSPDGGGPDAGLTAANGTLYGTTRQGGTSGKGTVYSISTDGVEKVLHSFGGSFDDGAEPLAGLINVKGTLYGTTFFGGASDKGTVYSISTDGAEKVLHSFGGSPDADFPQADLINVNGTLYGTTFSGGASDRGTVYSISTDGAEKVLYSFGGSPDGADPLAGLINVNGALYGTTYFGGSDDDGTVYRISTDGAETVMWRFDGAVDGAHPEASLVLATDTGRYKALYGTARDGGLWDKGTVYEFYFDRTRTEVKVLEQLGRGSDGANPTAPLFLFQDTLYGTTSTGGTSDRGTVYALMLLASGFATGPRENAYGAGPEPHIRRNCLRRSPGQSSPSRPTERSIRKLSYTLLKVLQTTVIHRMPV